MRFTAPALIALSGLSTVTAPLINVEERTGTGLCANLKNTKLEILGHNYGEYSACLCVLGGTIDSFISSNSVAKAAKKDWTAGIVATALELTIATAIDSRVASCSSSPSARKRSPEEVARSEHRCDFGLDKCGVYSAFGHGNGRAHGSGSEAAPYECIDTRNNLESCGGCVVPYALDDYEDGSRGVDCTSLPGVSDVDCHLGQCLVRKCAKGWELALSEEDVNGTLLECVKVKKHHGGSNNLKETEIEGELHQQVGGKLAWKKHEM